MQNYLNEGGQHIWTNGTGSDVSAGDVVTLTDRVGVAAVDIDNGDTGIVFTKGIFKLAKDTSSFAQGADVNWDISEDVCSSSSATGDYEKMGKCVKAAATGDSYVEVEINVPATMSVA